MENEESPPLTHLDSCCRTCMGSSVAMFDVYSRCNEYVIADLLTALVNIEIDASDGLPNFICAACYNKLNDFIIYISQATAADAKLRSQVKPKESQDTDEKKIKIKVEINQEQPVHDDDDFQDNVSDDVPESTQEKSSEGKQVGKSKKKYQYTCEKCFETFPRLLSLNKHKAKLHPETCFTCDVCKEIFKSKTKLEQHKLLHLQNDEDAKTAIKGEPEVISHGVCEEKVSQLKDNKKHVKSGCYACSMCSKQFSNTSHVKRHEKTHGINRPFKCGECLKSFYAEDMLLWHMNKLHDGKPLPVSQDELPKHSEEEDEKMEIKIELNGDQPHYDDVQDSGSDGIPDLQEGDDDVSLLVLKMRKFRYTCDVCFESFTRLNFLKEHKENVHPGAKPKCVFTCEVCNKSFNKNSKLKRHKLLHNPKRHKYPCTHCSASYKLHSSLENHRFLKHGPNAETQNDQDVPKPEIKAELEIFTCDVCQQTFQSRFALGAHSRKHMKPGRKKACSICSKEFKKLSHVRRHELTHEENRPFKCRDCPKCFNNEHLLSRHVELRHKGMRGPASQFTCAYCSKDFSYMSSLREHIKIHMGVRAYLCPTCGKRFHCNGNLKQHMRRHTGEKPFGCDMCPRKFISKGEMMYHRQSHTGEKPFSCDECGVSFTKHYSLVKHKRRHLGIKPHECDVCFMRFYSKDHLTRHYRSHTGEKPFRCDLCERAFTQSADLFRHKRAHFGDKMYKCTECAETFRLKFELNQHLSGHYLSSKLEAASRDKGSTADSIEKNT